MTVAIGPGLLAVAPVPATLRADPQEVEERSWLLVAALVGALVEAGAPRHPDGRPRRPPPAGRERGRPRARRPRASTRTSPASTGCAPARSPCPPACSSPATRCARRSARPIRCASPRRSPPSARTPPTRSRSPSRRTPSSPRSPARPPRRARTRTPTPTAASRGASSSASPAWASGAATTPSSAHLARGFNGNDKQLAEEIGERLIASGLLEEKLSVGQRHVFLNPRRARDVYALIEEGTLPAGLDLRR